jgi:hypothetical protein
MLGYLTIFHPLSPFTVATKIADWFEIDRNERKPVAAVSGAFRDASKASECLIAWIFKRYVPYAEAGLIAEGVVTLDSAAVKFAAAELILSVVGHGLNADPPAIAWSMKSSSNCQSNFERVTVAIPSADNAYAHPPVTNVRLWEVAKRLRFFFTFGVLPCLFLCRHDLVRQSAEKLEEHVWKRHNESEESTEERRKRGPGVAAEHKTLAQGLADLVRVNGKEIKSVL